jgi:hypothetical protein
MRKIYSSVRSKLIEHHASVPSEKLTRSLRPFFPHSRGHISWALCLAIVVVISTALPRESHAEVPDAVSYQGLLTLSDGSLVANGLYQIHFRIYGDPVLSNLLIFEQALSVSVQSGLYNVLLSSHGAQNLTESLQGASQAFMEVRLVSGPNGAINHTMTPRQRIASVPYALASPSGVPAGAIILWDQKTGCESQPGDCPCGFTVAGEFSGISVRGAGGSGSEIPVEPGESCPGSTQCTGALNQYDDALSESELATHGHPVMTFTDDGFTSQGGGGFPTGQNSNTNKMESFPPHLGQPGSVDGHQIGGAGGGEPHYHRFRTVLFCRKN